MTAPLKVDEPIEIDGVPYRVAEHPHAPGMVYGQEGRQAIVYQLVAGTEQRALKVFKSRYQVPALAGLANRLAPYASIPGLVVCRRTVLTASRHAALLRQYPDLTYAVLMPWVPGPTWLEVVQAGQPLAREQSLILARALAATLVAMEEQGVAHGDLSGPNLLLPAVDSDAIRDPPLACNAGTQYPIALVDVEQMYSPRLDRPRFQPGGSPGYAHATVTGEYWDADADRFAGAVLLAELLCWSAPRMRAGAWGESYFDPAEVQQDCARYRTLRSILVAQWGQALAGLLDSAWESATLAECPTFGAWLVALPDSVPPHPLRAQFAANRHAPVASARGDQTLADTNFRDDAPSARALAADTPDRPNAKPTSLQRMESDLTLEARAAPSAQKDFHPAELNRLFAEGWTAYKQGDWARARELLGAVVQQEPGYQVGRVQAARLFADADRWLIRADKSPQAGWYAAAGVALLLLILSALYLFARPDSGNGAATPATWTAQAAATQVISRTLNAGPDQAVAGITRTQNATATIVTVSPSPGQSPNVASLPGGAGETATAMVVATHPASVIAAPHQTQAAQLTAAAQAQASATHMAGSTATIAAATELTASAQRIAATRAATTAQAAATQEGQRATTAQAARAVAQTATAVIKHQTATAAALRTAATRSAGQTATALANAARAAANAAATATVLAKTPLLALAPVQLAPYDGQNYNIYPQGFNLHWSGISGADHYRVDVELYDAGRGTWAPVASPRSSDYGYSDASDPGPPAGWFAYLRPSKPGRYHWRVYGLDAAGRAGPKSGWWLLLYTPLGSPLVTP